MALVKCNDCGTDVSSSAKACPKCGAPPRKPTSKLHLVFAALVGMVVLSCVTSMQDAGRASDEKAAAAAKALASLPPEQKAALARAAADKERSDKKFSDGVVLAQLAAKTLKSRMRDPSSFQLAEATLLDDGTVCLAYRARNGFGGMAMERAAALADGAGIVVNPAQYNKLCANRTGTDISRVI